MDKTGEKILEKTDLKTLWSETLLELLQEAIENHWSNNAVREIVSELQQKGYSPKQLISRVKKKYGPEAAQEFGMKANFFTVADRPKTPGKTGRG